MPVNHVDNSINTDNALNHMNKLPKRFCKMMKEYRQHTLYICLPDHSARSIIIILYIRNDRKSNGELGSNIRPISWIYKPRALVYEYYSQVNSPIIFHTMITNTLCSFTWINQGGLIRKSLEIGRGLIMCKISENQRNRDCCSTGLPIINDVYFRITAFSIRIRKWKHHLSE